MKLLFIENRYKTFFFDAICEHLSKTHDVFWIVQNDEFVPVNGKVLKIPYPKKRELQEITSEISLDYEKIIASDRQINFFNKTDVSYLYYYANQLNKHISNIQPNFVFGEATAFHELLCIEVCKRHNILYLNPSSCRYPTGRFSFYEYDTLIPFKGGEEVLEEKKAKNIIDSISNRKAKPDYMKKVSFSNKKKILNKVKIIKSYLKGDVYNTPSPKIKLAKEKEKNKIIEKWDALAVDNVDENSFSVLYPLQMQPESNIDVWGRKNRDQFKTIKAIHQLLNEGEVLYVKPNPKSKYELSEELVSYIKEHDNVVAIAHHVGMGVIFNEINMVVTVTGTIAIECILSNKPVVTLIETLNNTAKNCLYAATFSQIKEYISMVKNRTYPNINEADQIKYLQLLNNTSFKGVISDPFSAPDCVLPENIKDLYDAFLKVIKFSKTCI